MEKLLVGHDENELCNLHQMIVELLLGEYVQTLRKQEKCLLYMKLHLWKTRIMPYHSEGRLTYSNLLKKYCNYNYE